MADKPKQAAKRGVRVPYPKERAGFQQLLFENPNYFGTFPESGLKPVLKLSGNTGYEELTCVGYNPDRDELEATVQIKLPTGYGGDLCSAGSTEYVRFYVDYGAGWEDAGLAAFNAHDIPNANDCARRAEKPLTYVVTYPHKPKRSFCGSPTLPVVRAILSWNAMPPEGEPDWPQVWGNTVDRHVQIRPRPFFMIDIADLLAAANAKKLVIPPELEYAKLHPIPLPDPPPLAVAELAEMYAEPQAAGAKAAARTELAVEPHRFALQELKAASTLGLVSQPALLSTLAQWQEIGLDIGTIIGLLEKTKGDVSYEELDCLGMDYNREWLVASLTIKQPQGYNGSLCQRGSLEYVAFWADWEDECEWEYLDTVKLGVHDIRSIPEDGLRYWVGLPVEARLSKHRGSCEEPKIARIRAVLSWNEAPSSRNPDAVPHWGNRLDAHVEIRPKESIGDTLQIAILGDVPTGKIAANGMTIEGAVFAGWGGPVDPHVIGPLAEGGTGSTRHCPFGGDVLAKGGLGIYAGGPYRYRLMVRESGDPGGGAPVTGRFVTVSEGGSPTTRIPDPTTGYLDCLSSADNAEHMLGNWHTGRLEGLWEIRVEIVDAAQAPVAWSDWYSLLLDNTAPGANVEISSGGACKDFLEGETIVGTLSATDAHFGHFDLYALPASLHPHRPETSRPASAESPDRAEWRLHTAADPTQGLPAMRPCGYVVKLDVYDRTIVHSQPGVHNSNSDDTGLCLRAKNP